MEGQIYIPFINWCLLIGCVLLVVGFKSSGALAAAYGIAVTGTMAITTAAFYVLARHQWRWRWGFIGPVCLLLITVDLIFFSSNLLKFWQGGYVPIFIGLFLFLIMHIWQWGKQWIGRAYAALPGLTVKEVMSLKEKNSEYLLHRSVVVLSANPIISLENKIPPSLDSFCQKWGVAVPKHLIFLSVVYLNKPRVAKEDRCEIITFQNDKKAGTIFSVRAYYGFMQTADIRNVLWELKEKGEIKIPADPEKWLVLVTGERFVSRAKGWFNRLRFLVFKFMLKASKPVSSYFGLGSDPQVVMEMINI
jgi:KUP system potassium uptake protein